MTHPWSPYNFASRVILFASVRRTSLRCRSISTFVIESIFGPRKYGVRCARASGSSRPDTKSDEQRILAVPASVQLSGLFGGFPGCPGNAANGSARRARAELNRTPFEDFIAQREWENAWGEHE